MSKEMLLQENELSVVNVLFSDSATEATADGRWVPGGCPLLASSDTLMPGLDGTDGDGGLVGASWCRGMADMVLSGGGHYLWSMAVVGQGPPLRWQRGEGPRDTVAHGAYPGRRSGILFPSDDR